MKYGFIAHTPLHVINVINIKTNLMPDEKIVLFICDYFDNYNSLSQSVSKHCPDIEVKTIKTYRGKNFIEKTYNRILRTINVILDYFPFYDDKIDHLYIPGDIYYSRLLYANQKKINPNLKVSYYEDGIGAYVGSPIFTENKLINWLNKKSFESLSWETALVYEPDLSTIDVTKNFKKIPKLNDKNKAKKLIRRIFNDAYLTDSEIINNSTIIFFDQPFSNNENMINEIEVYNELKANITNEDINFLVKLHPRSEINKYGDSDVLKTTLPWEVFVLNVNMNNLILIGVYTTALFSPYLMFGEKVSGIILAKLIRNLNVKRYDNSTLESLTNAINLTERFRVKFGNELLIPENYEELNENIHKLSGEIQL